MEQLKMRKTKVLIHTQTNFMLVNSKQNARELYTEFFEYETLSHRSCIVICEVRRKFPPNTIESTGV